MELAREQKPTGTQTIDRPTVFSYLNKDWVLLVQGGIMIFMNKQ